MPEGLYHVWLTLECWSDTSMRERSERSSFVITKAAAQAAADMRTREVFVRVCSCKNNSKQQNVYEHVV